MNHPLDHTPLMTILKTPVSEIKLLLVEDDPIILTMMSKAVESEGFRVLAATSNVVSAMESFKKNQPDAAILDIDLGTGPSGIDLANKMRKINHRIAIVFCTSYKDIRFIRNESHYYPPHTVLLKKAYILELNELSNAIYEALELIRDADEKKPDQLNEKFYKNLTTLEIELLAMVASGVSNKNIAKERGISTKSCENAIARLAKKLDIPATENNNQRVLLTRKYFELSGKTA
jgi:DNA-binding NarL/FixJ family response regulator